MSSELASQLDVQSHTSTGEWQGFESRMRRRRADRCLLRASAALDAEVPEAAEELLEEARTLYPDHPDLPDATNRLLSVGHLANPSRRRMMPVWAAAALVILLSVGAGWGGWVWLQTPEGGAVLRGLVTAATSAAARIR